MKTLIGLAERAILPDWLIRKGIRQLLVARLKEAKEQFDGLEQFADQLRQSPLAVHTDQANEQHYEVPARFFATVLGPHLKYSCAWWPSGCQILADAETRMLKLTCLRAEIEDGMKILELGCGWGSLTLWIAERFPECKIVALSNSNRQREWIMAQCDKLGLSNVEVITSDICDFDPDKTFDRVVSVEMFEHLRNYQILFDRIASWLVPGGKLFAHIFCHREIPYEFQTAGKADWMGRHFFTGGIMPAEKLLLQFESDLKLEQRWRINGQHYARTCEAWLTNLDQQSTQLVELFADSLNKRQARIVLQRWRMFFMACAELFNYQHGEEWFVSHYLFKNESSNSI